MLVTRRPVHACSRSIIADIIIPAASYGTFNDPKKYPGRLAYVLQNRSASGGSEARMPPHIAFDITRPRCASIEFLGFPED